MVLYPVYNPMMFSPSIPMKSKPINNNFEEHKIESNQTIIFDVNELKANEDKLENTWVKVELINGMVYSMYIKNINTDDISGSLFLGIVPCHLSDCHSRPILADVIILYDYIDNIIFTPLPTRKRANCIYAGKTYSPGSKIKQDGQTFWCHADGKWKQWYSG